MKRIMLAAVVGLLILGASPLFAQATEKATFAGGCFWCMEPPYDKLDGVLSTTSGYAGGTIANPTYQQVIAGGTGHLEVMQVTYDPSVITYEELLEVFWVNIDPTDAGGQFCDRGDQYQTAIFYHDEEQRLLAEESLIQVGDDTDFSFPIVTEIRELAAFYPAEDYHQDYYVKKPMQYRFYRTACGRDARLAHLWGEERTRIELNLSMQN